jgi:nucleotide-binding universal stress UspA family protein
MARFSTILCPVDFDQGAPAALRLAAELAQERKAILHVLHVVDLPPNVEVPLPFAELEARAATKLARLARGRVGAKARYRVHVTVGDPGSDVLSAARQLKAKLIVMATHGRKGLRRLILGSVAERVVREAPCPVLTVRPGTPRARPPRG